MGIHPLAHEQALIETKSAAGYFFPWYFFHHIGTIPGVPRKSPYHERHPALEAVGAAIRTLRNEAGVSQEALALAAGLDRSYLGGVERGEHNLALVNLIKVATATGVSASELLRRAGL